MLKIIADTNVLISAFIALGNEYEVLKLAKLEHIKIILSLELLEEFNNVIAREKFGFSKEQIGDFTKQILDITETIYSSSKIDAIKEDIEDNKVLEAAVDGKVDYIVSGDEHLLKLREFRGIKIVNAKEFLSLIKRTL